MTGQTPKMPIIIRKIKLGKGAKMPKKQLRKYTNRFINFEIKSDDDVVDLMGLIEEVYELGRDSGFEQGILQEQEKDWY